MNKEYGYKASCNYEFNALEIKKVIDNTQLVRLTLSERNIEILYTIEWADTVAIMADSC